MEFEKLIEMLWQEVKEEIDYNKRYEEEKENATEIAERLETEYDYWWHHMDRIKFPREPRKSIIKANLKMIRRKTIQYEKEL